MFVPRLRNAVLAAAAALSVSACYDDGYGYGGLSVGYGSAGYYDPYYGGYGSRYGSSYGYGYGYGLPSYYGWYDNFYYPGTGYYVYDRYQRRYPMNDRHRRYWNDRRQTFYRTDRADRPELRENWRAFRQERRVDDRAFRQERRTNREAFRQGTITRDQFRTERQADRRAYRQDLRQDRRELRRENRRDRRD
jgi:hypothetical protein